MPSITVRNISEEVHRGLRIRAARRGRSMEAELRDVLAIASGVRRPARAAAAAKPAVAPRNDPRTGARVPQELMEKLRDILSPAAE